MSGKTPEQEERRAAKARLVATMIHGQSWRDAVEASGLQISRTTAYRLRQSVRAQGEFSLDERRHGHASKLRAPVQGWLGAYCRGAPSTSSHVVQAMLRERFGLSVSVRHLNRIRAALGVSRVPPHRAKQGGGKMWGNRRRPSRPGKTAPAAYSSSPPRMRLAWFPRWTRPSHAMMPPSLAHRRRACGRCC